MSRKYTKIKELEPQILAMRAEGKTFPSCNFMIAASIVQALGKCVKSVLDWTDNQTILKAFL